MHNQHNWKQRNNPLGFIPDVIVAAPASPGTGVTIELHLPYEIAAATLAAIDDVREKVGNALVEPKDMKKVRTLTLAAAGLSTLYGAFNAAGITPSEDFR